MKKNKFKENIKYIRSCLGLTMGQMGNKFDMPLRRWQSYEDGRAEPSIDDLNVICDGVGIKMDQLTSETPISESCTENDVLRYVLNKK